LKKNSIKVARTQVQSIKDVMVLDAKTSDYLESFDNYLQ
jgi:hypothetical protein